MLPAMGCMTNHSPGLEQEIASVLEADRHLMALRDF